jgi:anti-anti-sigma factor
MEINVKQEKQLAVVAITGSVDALTSREVTRFLSQQIGDGKKDIVVDLSQVDFMSSAGLRAILAALKESRQQGGDLSLAGAQHGVDKVLKMSGFTNILKTYPTVAEAIGGSGR